MNVDNTKLISLKNQPGHLLNGEWKEKRERWKTEPTDGCHDAFQGHILLLWLQEQNKSLWLREYLETADMWRYCSTNYSFNCQCLSYKGTDEEQNPSEFGVAIRDSASMFKLPTYSISIGCLDRLFRTRHNRHGWDPPSVFKIETEVNTI